MNDEVEDPKWEEKLIKKLQDYNKGCYLFKDSNDIKKKVKYVIEDTRKIRFFEFSDNIIEKDVFDGDKDLGILVPKKRGRPRKTPISNDPPKPKRARGRPKTLNDEEAANRRTKSTVKYLNKRYNSDEEFKEKCKRKRREQYDKHKAKTKSK